MQCFAFPRVQISFFFVVFFCVAARAQALDPVDINVFYPGRLMGYFRTPNWQSPDKQGAPDYRSCPPFSPVPPVEQMQQSLSAQVFPALNGPHSILIGTGDNFAPELAARGFCLPPRLASATPSHLGT